MAGERAAIKETSSLSQSRKGPTRCYGATRNPENAPDFKLVPHHLLPSDTFQGLAIKYNVTVEQIRRVNKLWTSDNICIYKTLYIPVKIQDEDIVDYEGVGVDIEDVNIEMTIKKKDWDMEDRVQSRNNPKNGESLSKYLNKLDDQMKSPIKQAEIQRTDSGPALINNLETRIEKAIEDCSKTEKIPKNIPKQRTLLNKPRKLSQNNLDRVDDLFEL